MAQYVTVLLLVLLAFVATTTQSESSKYQYKRLKETNMVFYMHDIVIGTNITAIPVAGVPTPIPKGYNFLKLGMIVAIDDKLTAAYEWDSPQVGRARGSYVNSALDGSDLHFTMSVWFTNKEYNGSTLEIQGSDRLLQKYREVSVVSGTGKFRFARGFAVLETVYLDLVDLYGIIRWNVTLLHY